MGTPAIQPSLKTIQAEHREWIAHNFPGETDHQAVFGMVEELGELAHHLLKREQGIRGGDNPEYHDAEIRDACADLVIFMMTVADNEGFDLMDAILEAWDTVKRRDWVKFPVDGVTE